MSEIGTSGTAGTRAFCGECGEAVAADERFCSECGHPLAGAEEPTVVIDPVPAAASAMNGNGTAANGAAAPNGTATPPPGHTQPGYAPYATGAPVPPQMAGVPPQGPPIAYPAPAYPVPAPPPRTNTGLIIGLIAAGFAAVGLIVAVVLLATRNHSTAPTITTTNASAPAVTPVSPSPGTTLATSGPKNAGKLKSPKPVATPAAPAVSTPAPAPTPTGPTAADRAAAAQVVTDQWNLIGSENFTAAAQKWSPAMGSDWLSSHQAEAPISVSNLSVGSPTMNSATDATVPLNSLTTTASDGCMNWTGSYDVIKVGSQWFMHQANINGTKC